MLSPKPLNGDVAQRLDLTQPNPDQAQLRGSSSFDNVSGQTGTDSRATKRSSESPERREAALRLRSNPPAHHDPIDVPIHSAGSGLSSNAPMSERRLMTGLLLRLGTGDLDLALLPLDMEGFLRINRSTTPSSPHSFKSELRAALPTGKKIVAEIMTLIVVLLRLLPQVAAILLHLSFNDCFSRSTTRSRGARPKSRDAELRLDHVGMISTPASVRSRRSITVLTPLRRRLNHPSLPSPELSQNTRLSSVSSTSGSPEARRR